MRKMKLILPAILLLATVNSEAKPYAEGSIAPMPNLMPIILHHGEMLDLSEAQKTRLKDWREKHHHGQHSLSKEIRDAKKAMLKAALDGKNLDDLLAMETKIESRRITFITKKAACRDNMKRILSPEQWEMVMDIYFEENSLITTAGK